MKRTDRNGIILRTGEYQRKDGRYQFSVMRDGKRYTLYDNNLNLLRIKSKKLMSELISVKKKQNCEGYTIDTYAEYWFNVYGHQGRKPTTLQLYKNKYKCHLKNQLGDIPLEDVKRQDIQKVFNDLINMGLKSSTIEITKHCLNNILETAEDEGHIKRNPVKGIMLPKEPKNKREAVEKGNLKLFLDFIHHDSFYSFYEPFFIVLFYTGMRIGECCALTWDDIDLKNRIIYINKTQIRLDGKIYIGSPKSQSSYREIPMNDIVYECLSDMKKNNNSRHFLPVINDTGRECRLVSEFLFFSTRNKILTESTVRQAIKHIVKKENNKLKEFVPHQSRHTFTSLAYEAGIDVKYTSMILGHSSIKITLDQYTHLSEEFNKKQKETFRKLGL